MNGDDITLKLSRAEAIVLFEWLASIESHGPVFKHISQENVLARIEGQLESILVEPFAPNYKELVDEATRMLTTPRRPGNK
jgi:hypothetical protein